MIIYRRLILPNSNEKERKALLQERGIFALRRSEAQTLKEYAEINNKINLDHLKLGLHQKLKDLFCYEIPSNKPEYLFDTFSSNTPSKVNLKIFKENKSIVLELDNLTSTDLLLFQQLIYKLDYKTKKYLSTFNNKKITITFKELSKELYRVCRFFNKDIVENLNKENTKKLFKRCTSLEKKILKEEILEQKLISSLTKKGLVIKERGLIFEEILFLLPLYNSPKLPFLGYDIGLEKEPVLTIHKNISFIKQLPCGFFTTREITKDTEKEYIGFHILKKDYNTYYGFLKILKDLFSDIQPEGIIDKLNNINNSNVVILVDKKETLIL